MKKLYQSRTDRVAGGVLGGLGAYFHTDSTLLRFAFVVLLILTGIFPGVVIYIVAMLMLPKEPLVEPSTPTQTEGSSDAEHHDAGSV